MDGKQVRLFLADGTPGGLLTAEIMNWTGHVVAAPRSDLADLLDRPEVARTGVYLLLGDDPESPGRPIVYIGEGDDVRKRLYQHGRDAVKDFWERAVVVTSKDLNLTKAHARYLESRFIALALAAGRSRLANGTSPQPINLPEADVSDMEYFITQAQIILPVLGINALRATPTRTGRTADGLDDTHRSPVFVLKQDKAGVLATAQEVDGEFTVRAGSRGRSSWTGTGVSYRTLRSRLESEGVLVETGDGATVTLRQDYTFASPSAASAVLLGRSSNGRLEWKVQDSALSYGDWQARLLDTTAGELMASGADEGDG